MFVRRRSLNSRSNLAAGCVMDCERQTLSGALASADLFAIQRQVMSQPFYAGYNPSAPWMSGNQICWNQTRDVGDGSTNETVCIDASSYFAPMPVAPVAPIAPTLPAPGSPVFLKPTVPNDTIARPTPNIPTVTPIAPPAAPVAPVPAMPPPISPPISPPGSGGGLVKLPGPAPTFPDAPGFADDGGNVWPLPAPMPEKSGFPWALLLLAGSLIAGA